jgi:hypothetical protein
LPYRDVRQDAIGEVCGLVAHAAIRAARADAAALARERDEHVVPALVAPAAQKALVVLAACEVLAKLVDHVFRKGRRVARVDVLEQLGEVILHDAIEDGLFRATRDVARRQRAGDGGHAVSEEQRWCRRSW